MTVHVLTMERGRKPPSYLPAVPADALSWLAGNLGPAERLAMREIVERGDLIHVDGQTYLVAPVTSRCIDALAMFEAESGDREHGADDEPSILTYGDLESDGGDQ